MGHCIQGFIARLEPLLAAARSLAGARVTPLAAGMGFLPLVGDWADLSQPAADPPEATHLTVPMAEWAAAFSRQFPIAYIETDYIGGVGSQVGVLWEGGQLVLTTERINTALVRLGVVASGGTDEFDKIGLGWHRSNERWYEAGKPP
jgi:hypothetical protein